MASKYPKFLEEELDKVLTEFPEVPTRTLAKRVYSQHKKFFKDIEQVRSALRRRRGNSGMASTKDKKHIRENGKAGWTPKLPPSQAKEWLPYVIAGPERIALINDLHIPYHNNKVLEQWLKDAQEYEPSIILINGDLLDFYRLSRFDKDPNNRDTAYEIDAVHDFLDWLQHYFAADIIFKEGNHDERWRRYLFNHAPEIAKFKQLELGEILELEERKIQYVADKRIIMAGDLPILHGHEFQGSSAINPARSMANKLTNSALQGHCHRSSEYLERNVLGHWIKCYSVGCMCELTPEYSRINRWNNGYAFIDIHEDGSFEIQNVVID